MTQQLAILVEHVAKTFGEVEALSDVSLSIPKGNILGVLGPNGAGKTTLVRILATLIKPSAGRAMVEGFDCVSARGHVRSRIALVSQASAMIEPLTGRQKLMLNARLHHLPRAAAKARVEELLGRFDLDDAADRPIATYSGGMQRRLDLATGLLAFPAVLFLDEPTTGLDPRSRIELWQLVREATAAGTTTVLTTQYLDEADELADQIAVLGRGRLLALDTPSGLKNAIEGGVLRFGVRTKQDAETAVAVVSRTTNVTATFDERPYVSVPLPDRSAGAVTSLLDALRDEGLDPLDLTVEGPSLDSAFLALTDTSMHAQEGASS
ncbi:MAG: type transport system ATP-binding protein [Actinomycetota bacterium]|jgi:ABC-2 type transport system ATP-binding protein